MFNGNGESKPSRPSHFMMFTGINERDVAKLDHPLFITDTVSSREVETTVFDPASVFLSTH